MACREHWISLIVIVLFAIATRFFLLGIYPYVQIGDGLRDAGIGALQIKDGSLDPFGFGSYNGYGNFVPLISYYFFLVMGRSAYIYLLPSAVVGIVSIVLTFVIAYLVGNKKIAFLSAILISVSLSHMHYSRSELVVISDSLISLLLILAVYSATIATEGFLLTGLMYGFAMHFYAGTRGIMLAGALFLFVIFLMKFWRCIKKEEKYRSVVMFAIIGLLLFGIGAVIGLGPTINHLNKSTTVTSVGTPHLIFFDPLFTNRSFLDKLGFIYSNYEKAVAVFIFNPISMQGHFPWKASLISAPINLFFLFGFAAFFLLGFIKRSRLTVLMLMCIFIIPFTNEVILNDIGVDHRLLSVIPLLNIVAAFGLYSFIHNRNRLVSVVVWGVVVFFVIHQFHVFFVQRVSDLDYEVFNEKEYALQQMSDYMRRNPADSYFILNEYPFNYDFVHYAEKFSFFIEKNNVRIIGRDKLMEEMRNQPTMSSHVKVLYVSGSPNIPHKQERVITISCKPKPPTYVCPINRSIPYSFTVLDL